MYVQELHEESCGRGTTSDHSTSKLVERSSASKLCSSDATSECASAGSISTGLGDGVVAGWLMREGAAGGRYRFRTTVAVRLVSDRNKVRAESSVNEVGKYCTLH